MKDPKNSIEESANMAKLIRALANLIDKSSDEEISALLRGQATLSVKTKENSRVISMFSSEELQTLIKNLQGLSDREEGQRLLESMSFGRRELERLGKLLSISILKSDNMERLNEKIIEATIGARLNSLAIRGDDRPSFKMNYDRWSKTIREKLVNNDWDSGLISKVFIEAEKEIKSEYEKGSLNSAGACFVVVLQKYDKDLAIAWERGEGGHGAGLPALAEKYEITKAEVTASFQRGFEKKVAILALFRETPNQ